MAAPATDLALHRSAPRRVAPLSRAAFRARLDEDPRRWVLALAAAEGLVGFAVVWSEKVYRPGPGYLLLIPVAFALVAPVLGVVALYAQAMVLSWAGRMLGGHATRVELRAALAWSQVPVLLVGWPAVLQLISRIAVAESEPVPGAVLFLDDLAQSLARWTRNLALPAGLLGLVLYVRYLGEAEGITGVRAVVSHVLAVLLAVLVLAAGLALGWALSTA